MSSDLFVFDGSFNDHSSPEMFSSDCELFFSDSFSPFCDSSSIGILQDLSSNQNTQTPIHNSNSLESLTHQTLLPSSPPSHQLENLTLYSNNIDPIHTHLHALPNEQQNFTNCQSFSNGYLNFSGFDSLEVKTEEYQQPFMPRSYTGVENVAKFMQRSYSSNCFDGNNNNNDNKPCNGFLFQPSFDTLLESPNNQNQHFGLPENGFFAPHLRRVCSTGDLQSIRPTRTTQRSFSSPLATENSFVEESNFKVGRYSAEQRKERISKYRAKRNQRNFTKTIKYACRKTLADNRPRIRGRFARNDEPVEIPKAVCFSHEDEDDLWFDGLHEEEDGAMRRGGGLGDSFSQPQFNYYHAY